MCFVSLYNYMHSYFVFPSTLSFSSKHYSSILLSHLWKAFYVIKFFFYRLLEDRPGDEENLDNLGFEEISDEELEEEARANKGSLSPYYYYSLNLTTTTLVLRIIHSRFTLRYPTTLVNDVSCP